MNVWLCLPTVFDSMASATLPAWMAHGCKIAAVSERDGPASAMCDELIRTQTYRGWAWSVNEAARIALDLGADIIVAAGDDHWPDRNLTADQIAAEVDRLCDPMGLCVLQPAGDLCGVAANGWGGRHHCSSSWFTAEYARRVYGGKGLFWPEYHHLYADTEAYEVANLLGVFHEAPHITQRHDHAYRTGRKARPGPKSAKGIGDSKLYQRRKAAGFPGHELIPCPS